MFLNLEFLGKDGLTKEDKLVFRIKKSKFYLEIYCQSIFYNFKIKKGKKIIRDFDISDKKLGNNTPAIEIKSFTFIQELEKQDIFLNLGYNGAGCFLFCDLEKISFDLTNPIGETVESFVVFWDDLED